MKVVNEPPLQYKQGYSVALRRLFLRIKNMFVIYNVIAGCSWKKLLKETACADKNELNH